MNFREVFCWSFLTFLLLECLFVRCVNSLPARDTLTVEATQASAAQTIKIESTTSNHKGVEEKPSSGFQNDVEGNANLTEVKGDGGFTWFPRGFLNWIYPNPSILKQNFYRWFFNGIIMGGVFVQYDTVKRQILVTLAKVLTQFKKEKAERDKIRQEAQLYDNSYNNQYPDGYQNQEPEYQPSLENGYEDKPAYQPSDSEIKEEQLIYIPSDGDNKKEQPAYQPSDGGNKEVQPAYQPPEGDVKGEKPEYQPSVVAFEKEKPEYQSSDDEIEKDRPVYQPTDGDTENEKIDYQLIEKRSQHLGGEYSINTKVSSYPNEIFKNVTDISVSSKESSKTDTRSTPLKIEGVNVTENPLKNYNKTADTDHLADRGFLNWIYPNPSTLKQNFYTWFFDGIIALGAFVQYDTIKRQILVTLQKVLTQWKIEKAERDEQRKDAELYYNSYNYPYGYQNPVEYQNQHGYEEEKPEYHPQEEASIKKKPEYQAQKGEVKAEKPEYQPSTDDEPSSYNSYSNEHIEKRRQYLGDRITFKSNVDASSVRERLIGLTDKVCFQKSLCQLEKLSSISPSMARLWFEVSNFFSSSVWENRLQSQNKHILNCEVEFRACQVSTLELIKYLLQQ